MGEKWGWPGALGAAIFVCIFASVAIAAAGGWAWVRLGFTWLDFTTGSTAASWAQAAGSVAAVWVALSLANKGDRREHQEDLDHASLVAARLTELVDGILETLRTTHTMLKLCDESDADRVATLAVGVRAARQAMRSMPTDLTSLVPLPNHAAHRLARALAILESLSDQTESKQDWGSNEIGRKCPFLDSWKSRLDECVNLLRVSKSELSAAVERVAPHPTTDELYDPRGDANG